ncbi:SagB/ThcOx family dehydrogenase [Patescibacteria group bacterium]
MTKERLKEVKITNQVLAILVVMLSLSLGIAIGKQKGWVRNNASKETQTQRQYIGTAIELESIKSGSNLSVNSAIKQRRTRRQFIEKEISPLELSQLLWSLQGITASWGGRTVPTIKSAYPLEISVIVKNAENVGNGIYHYSPKENTLNQTVKGLPQEFVDKSKDTPSLREASVVFIISAKGEKLEEIIQNHNDNLLYLEAGHAAQNLLLQAEALGLGVNNISLFDSSMKKTLNIPESEVLIYLLPVGTPKES